MLGGVAESGGEVGALEEGFGGDAAPEDAGAAQAFALDDADVHAELGGADGAYVAGGAGADEQDGESGHGGLVDEQEWVFDELAEGLQELGAGGAVDDAVVATHGDAEVLADCDGAVDDGGFGFDGADCQDTRFWRVNDGGELVDAEHTQVRD